MEWLYFLLFGLFAIGFRYAFRRLQWEEGLDIEAERLPQLQSLCEAIDKRLGISTQTVDHFLYDWKLQHLVEWYTIELRLRLKKGEDHASIRDTVQQAVFEVVTELFQLDKDSLDESSLVRNIVMKPLQLKAKDSDQLNTV